MTTITLEVPDALAQQLHRIGDRLPARLAYALDVSGIPTGEVAPRTAWVSATATIIKYLLAEN